MNHIVKIREIVPVTHDVKSFRLEKPAGYRFTPGQATDVSINKPGLTEEIRPFTFTALNEAPYLEFTIKRYAEHHGVTDQLHQLKAGEELIIRDVWGAIEYKGEGYFIAGGAGITPFLAILRQLHESGKIAGNRLFFSNKTEADIIYEKELKKILGDAILLTLTREKNTHFENSRIDRAFLRKQITDFKKHFYICGPDSMVAELNTLFQEMGASSESLVFEK